MNAIKFLSFVSITHLVLVTLPAQCLIRIEKKNVSDVAQETKYLDINTSIYNRNPVIDEGNQHALGLSLSVLYLKCNVAFFKKANYAENV